MKQLVFHVLFWMFSGGSLYINKSTEIAAQQTFSKVHVAVVTEKSPERLKEIDVLNPLFIFK